MTLTTVDKLESLEVWQKKYSPEKIYDYFDLGGRLIFKIFRIPDKNKNGTFGKTFRPFLYCKSKDKFYDKMDHLFDESGYAKRPLYNLKNIDRAFSGKALIVEGEKCVDEVEKKYGDKLWVTTWSGGGTSLKNTDWAPLANFDQIYFWRDKDQTGDTSLELFKELFNDNFSIVNVDRFPDKYDVYDFLQVNADIDLVAYLEKNSTLHAHLDLRMTQDKKVYAEYNNVLQIFEKTNEWHKKIGFNDLNQAPELRVSNLMCNKGPWDESHTCAALKWAMAAYNFKKDLPVSLLELIISTIAYENRYNPLTEYLNSLKWDGVDRFAVELKWLVANSSEYQEYTYQTVKLWMHGAINRAYNPGCDFQQALIIGGRQGIGKSTFFEKMAMNEAWFSDSKIKIGDAEVYKNIQGKWIIEFGELASMQKATEEDIKNFISSKKDNYRASYAKRNKDYLRRCVFGGTVNKQKYLVDSTGGRRYLPLNLIHIEWKYLNENVLQFWAQIVHEFKNGVVIPEHPLLKAMQDDKYQGDSWDDLIAQFIYQDGREYYHVNDIMYGALNIQPEKYSKPVQMRVAECLERLGFTSKQKRDKVLTGGRNLTLWSKDNDK